MKPFIDADVTVKGARVGILGITFKEDCNDLRNSKVPDIHRELRRHRRARARSHGERARGAPRVRHPARRARSHKQYLDLPVEQLTGMLRKGGLLLDVKSALDPARVGAGVRYWSL